MTRCWHKPFNQWEHSFHWLKDLCRTVIALVFLLHLSSQSYFSHLAGSHVTLMTCIYCHHDDGCIITFYDYGQLYLCDFIYNRNVKLLTLSILTCVENRSFFYMQARHHIVIVSAAVMPVEFCINLIPMYFSQPFQYDFNTFNQFKRSNPCYWNNRFLKSNLKLKKKCMHDVWYHVVW